MRTIRGISIAIIASLATMAQAQYIVNDAFKKITLEISDRTTSGAIGTAYETVDHFSSFAIVQTTPGVILALPTPTDTTWGDDVTVRNTGTTSFTMYGVEVLPDSFDVHLTWKRGAWRLVGGYSAGGGDCNCCDSLLYFPNDTAAHNNGWFNKDDYYLLSADNSYGWAWGTLKQITEDVGFYPAATGNEYGAPSGGIVGTQLKVGFNGRSPRCKYIPPDNTLAYYESDTAAYVDLAIGDYYMCALANVYGMPVGTIKRITAL